MVGESISPQSHVLYPYCTSLRKLRCVAQCLLSVVEMTYPRYSRERAGPSCLSGLHLKPSHLKTDEAMSMWRLLAFVIRVCAAQQVVDVHRRGHAEGGQELDHLAAERAGEGGRQREPEWKAGVATVWASARAT